jgi:UDP-N-acetylglucosamine/UDP-N-acetylgalactosamine diphosphorylase
MTSGPTRADTEAFFRKENFFGLDATNVIFFEQGVLPAFTFDGKIILEEEDKISVAPDGNGGVYAGLRTSGVLEDMKKRGVSYLHAYCVDNCLVRVGDPTFVGFCISKNVQCGAKVVRKVDPAEPVGVVCRVDGKYGVVEYSEISKEDSERKNDNGRLVFDAANIANHFYTLPFLQKVCSRKFEDKLDYHVAHKKIKYFDAEAQKQIAPSKPNGIKLELFIFDIFPFLEKNEFAVFSVPRSDEFSPLKNAPGAGADCPETSRRDLFLQSIRFIQQAGGSVKGALGGMEKIKDGEPEVPVFEISPLVSLDGEDLEKLKGKSITVDKPTYIATLSDLGKFQ